jgi:basic membrane protein A
VQLLGWDEARQDGSIAGSFTDQAAGERIANDFIAQGADIILPVAGQTGLGTASAAGRSNGRASVIWVDTDGYLSAPQYRSVFLSSVTKDISGAVFEATRNASANRFSTAPYIGGLRNGGVGLAPYHDFASKVPQALTAEIEQLRQDIIAGKIRITSPNQPRSGG